MPRKGIGPSMSSPAKISSARDDHEDAPQHVAERAHDLDHVPGQRDEHPEECEGELVEDRSEGRPLILAPGDRECAPAHEDEQRDGQQSLPLEFVPLDRDGCRGEHHEPADDPDQPGPPDGSAQREGEVGHPDGREGDGLGESRRPGHPHDRRQELVLLRMLPHRALPFPSRAERTGDSDRGAAVPARGEAISSSR